MSSFKSKQKATSAVNLIAAKLKEDTGVEWEKDVFENLGWHCGLHYGSFNISLYNYEEGLSFSLLNGGHHLFHGNASLSIYHPKNYTDILLAIKASYLEQVEMQNKWINSVKLNKEIKFLKH